MGAMASLALLAGCAARVRRVTPPSGPPQPALVATKSDLAARYSRQAQAVRSLNAAVRMKAVTGSAFAGVVKEYREIGGYILAQRPGWIRVIGQAPVVGSDIFDMVSDGKTFRMYVPSKKRFVVGPARLERAGKNAVENLRPQPLYEALLWQPIPAQEPVVIEEDTEEQPLAKYYVLTALRHTGQDWEIDRRIWFDRSDLEVSRIEIFGESGRLESDFRYSAWQEQPGGVKFPAQVLVTEPQGDYRLEIDITKVRLNEEIPQDRFRLEQPPGTKLEDVGKTGGQH